MREARSNFSLFVGLVVLILLAGGAAVGLAAYLTVAPQPGAGVEVEAEAYSYGINDQLFYPWNAYAPEEMARLVPWAQGESRDWYEKNLVDIPAYLGFSGMQGGLEQGRTGSEAGFWMDCPVTAAHGQPALLDVAYAHQGQQFGLGWVARSTGELPTQAQRDGAMAQVEQDVCAWLEGEEDTPLEDLILHLTQALSAGSTQREHTAAAALAAVLQPLPMLREIAPLWVNGRDFSAVCQGAASQGLHIQLATTQRQVVLVLSAGTRIPGSTRLLAVYYDMALEQYSGLVINATD